MHECSFAYLEKLFDALAKKKKREKKDTVVYTYTSCTIGLWYVCIQLLHPSCMKLYVLSL